VVEYVRERVREKRQSRDSGEARQQETDPLFRPS
jgi:hypothetical protein